MVSLVSGHGILRACLKAFVEELAAGDNAFQQAAEVVVVRGRVGLHFCDEGFIAQDECPPQPIGQKLAAQVVDEVVAPVLSEIADQSIEPLALRSARKLGSRIDRMSGQVHGPSLTHGAVAFKDQTHGIKTGMAFGAAGSLPMGHEGLAQRELISYP